MRPTHVPVMVDEVLALLAPRPGARIVDATTGHGGHAERILDELGDDGELIGLDRDPEMLAVAERRLARFGARARLVHARMGFLREVIAGTGLEGVDGVLMDLGVNSAHLDDRGRGFAFQAGEEPVPLDMRMDQSRGETAAELIARLDTDTLAELLRRGEVPMPQRVARAIHDAAPVRTVQDLLGALERVPAPRRRHHPATLVFQALRMAVNNEISELETGLEAALGVLVPGGRLAVLSYHSGEDRMVKQFLAREAKGCICPPKLPVCGCGHVPRLETLARGIKPSADEIARNPRARSARLRGGKRC